MQKLTVAIPTRNRLPFLRRTLEHMLGLPAPEGLEVNFSVAATASQDGTPAYLNSLIEKELRVTVNTRQTTWTRWNLIHLAKIVPIDSDWVWLFGDDDMLVDGMCWKKIADLINIARAENASIICIPQAKRVPQKEAVYVDHLASLCGRFGLHEVLGWMTSLVMRRDVFAGFSAAMRIRFASVRTDTGMRRSRVSPFFHALELFSQYGNTPAVLALKCIVDEQTTQAVKKMHTEHSRNEEHLRDRLVYTFAEYLDLLKQDGRARSLHFYRYVNKTFLDLMINIISEDCLRKVPSHLVQPKIDQLSNLVHMVNLDNNARPYLVMLSSLQQIGSRTESLSDHDCGVLKQLFELTRTPYLGEIVSEPST